VWADLGKKHIGLDDQQSIFHNMGKVAFNDLVMVRGRLYNRVIESYPCIVHFNGFYDYQNQIAHTLTLQNQHVLDVFFNISEHSQFQNSVITLPYRLPFIIQYGNSIIPHELPQLPEKRVQQNKKNVVCCITVRDCAEYLVQLFKNLENLGKELGKSNFNFTVIFVHDNCSDGTERYLYEYKYLTQFDVVVLHCANNFSEHRTFRLANARNCYLKYLYEKINPIKKVDYHIVLDGDSVNTDPWDIQKIKQYMENDKNNWDCLTFNRKCYYDIWALFYGPHKHHCFGFNDLNGGDIVDYIKMDVQHRLRQLGEEELMECWSAFNGFAMYRTDKFEGCDYNGSYADIKELITDEDRKETVRFYKSLFSKQELSINEEYIEHCEHVYYHLCAIRKHQARIRISKHCLQ